MMPKIAIRLSELDRRMGWPTDYSTNRIKSTTQSLRIPRIKQRLKAPWIMAGEHAMALAVAGTLYRVGERVITPRLMLCIAKAYRPTGMIYDVEALWHGRFDKIYIADGRYLSGDRDGDPFDLLTGQFIRPELASKYVVRLELDLVPLRAKLITPSARFLASTTSV